MSIETATRIFRKNRKVRYAAESEDDADMRCMKLAIEAYEAAKLSAQSVGVTALFEDEFTDIVNEHYKFDNASGSRFVNIPALYKALSPYFGVPERESVELDTVAEVIYGADMHGSWCWEMQRNEGMKALPRKLAKALLENFKITRIEGQKP